MKRTYFTRLAALALTLILALSLTACGGKDTNTDADNSGDTKTTVKIGVPNDTTTLPGIAASQDTLRLKSPSKAAAVPLPSTTPTVGSTSKFRKIPITDTSP